MNASASVRGVARHPVLAFMLISLGFGFVTAAIQPIVDSEILPLGRPLHGVVMSLGAGLAAFPLRPCPSEIVRLPALSLAGRFYAVRPTPALPWAPSVG
jgi:hypothetical protein